MSYAWSKLQLAVNELAQEGTRKERLAAAIANHLLCIHPKEIPEEARKIFIALTEAISCDITVPRHAKVSRWIASLDDREIKRTITAIITLYDAVTRHEPISAATATEGHGYPAASMFS